LKLPRPGWISVLRILRIEPYLDTVSATSLGGAV
jgi:hypothetical protein